MTVQTWRYDLHGNQQSNGGVFFIDSTGLCLAYSAYGAYGHRWTHPGCPIRRFIADLEPDYVYRKLLLGRLRESEPFDGAATMRRVRAEIFEIGNPERRATEIDRISDYGTEFDDDRDFEYWFSGTTIDEAWNFRETRRDRECWAFCTKLMPRLQTRLRLALRKEAGAAALVDAQFGVSVRA